MLRYKAPLFSSMKTTHNFISWAGTQIQLAGNKFKEPFLNFYKIEMNLSDTVKKN